MAKQPLVKIYALSDPLNPALPRYIGATCQELRARLQQHLWQSSGPLSPKKFRWIKELLDRQQIPVIRCLEITPASEAAGREQHWIDFFKPLGCLVNHFGGGVGMVGKKHSPQSKAKMSEKRRGVPKTEKQWLATLKSRFLVSKPVICIETGQKFPSEAKAGLAINRHPSNISRVIGTDYKCGGYHWSYSHG